MPAIFSRHVMPASKPHSLQRRPAEHPEFVATGVEDQDEPPSFDVFEFARRFPFVVCEAVLPQLEVTTKQEAVAALVASLARHRAIPEAEQASITAAALRREELGSTGVGRGAAIPHAKHPSIPGLIATLAYCPQGLEYDSLDGKPVHLICLLLSPPDQHTAQLLAMQKLAKEILALDAWA
jgi:PTS system nitrogen regulatory IIA component